MAQKLKRFKNRRPDELRKVTMRKNVAPRALGSVLCSFGRTSVICAVTSEEVVPKWMKEQGTSGGWITAEYSMLPYSTEPRKARDIARGRLSVSQNPGVSKAWAGFDRPFLSCGVGASVGLPGGTDGRLFVALWADSRRG